VPLAVVTPPDVPQTPVILPDSAAIPPAVPADPPSSEPAPPPADVAPAPVATPAPTPVATPVQPALLSTPTPAAAPPAAVSSPPTAPAPTTASNPGNTTGDNPNSITANNPLPTPDNTSQTLVWNWYWNCDNSSLPPGVPPLPAGTTAIVLNWHWSCDSAAPPTTSVTGVTVCVGCNIAIAVRIASPGDSGAIIQTTGAVAASLAASAAATAQTAAQGLLPALTPQPPAVVAVPAPVSPAPPAAAAPATGPTGAVSPTAAAPTAAAPTLTATNLTAPLAAGSAPTFGPTDDAPRHGVPDFSVPDFSRAGGFSWAQARANMLGGYTAPGAGNSLVWGLGVIVSAAAARTPLLVREQHATSGTPRALTHGRGLTSPPPPLLPPPAPTPFVLAPAASGLPSAGSPITNALAAGAIGAFLLLFFAYAAPGLQTARSRYAHVHPDPPG
jgi:hypothetical protein